MNEVNDNEQLNKLEELEKQCAEYLDGWKRAKADLINYQKDEAKRFSEMTSYAREIVLSDIIPVLDSFELAIMHSPVRGGEGSQPDSTSNGEGLERIKNQLEDTLKRHGLEKIKAGKGDEFNPQLHESIGEQEDEEVESGKISAVVGSGYKVNGKVVRPTRVKLSK